MSNDDVINHIIHLLAESFEVERAAIEPTATLADLDLDSLAVVEFNVALGEYYDVPLGDSDSDKIPLTLIAEKVTALVRQKD
ncbi:acyl carrier protein [Streptomyces violaceusniger]|uniref:Carrier domain-containing protein n=1 Tax=Streptomyces violaceusniger (strain Tu 4113) TaxID=653045 RepID=G2PHJ9_STRV4|nr:phosphopantetheine-binding protein [Streptomyces violaceusniger]AEM89002.1 hypothetical protein Strvi_0229 [Streptomyces violaceusniger Tu 4113]